MKRFWLMSGVVLMAVALCLAGCGDKEEEPVPETTTTTLAPTPAPAPAPAPGTAPPLNQEQMQYKDYAGQRFAELDDDYEWVKVKAAQTHGKARADFQPFLDDLARKRAAAYDKLRELQKSGSEAWPDIKREMDRTLDAFAEVIARAREHVKKVDAAAVVDTARKAARTVEQAAGNVADNLARERDELSRRINRELAQVDRQFEHLKKVAHEAAGPVKGELKQLVDEVGAKRQLVRQKLRVASRAGHNAYAQAKREVDQAMNALQDAVRRAEQKAQNPPPPPGKKPHPGKNPPPRH